MEHWQEGRRTAAGCFPYGKKGLEPFFFMKALRTKKIKVNGKKMEPSYRLMEGDAVRSFVLEIKKAGLWTSFMRTKTCWL